MTSVQCVATNKCGNHIYTWCTFYYVRYVITCGIHYSLFDGSSQAISTRITVHPFASAAVSETITVLFSYQRPCIS